MLIKDIVEDEGALYTEGRILWLYINRGSYQGKRVQVFDDAFRLCVSVSLRVAFRVPGFFFGGFI